MYNIDIVKKWEMIWYEKGRAGESRKGEKVKRDI